MMRKILIISLILTTNSLAASDKDIAEFNRLFNEYTQLTENLTDLNKAIAVAEEVYKLAPRIYGRESEEYSIVTYNLASLYDIQGGNGIDPNEKDLVHRGELKASDLYKKYFRMQNLRKVPKDFDYLGKFYPYMEAYYNSHPGIATLDVSKTFLKIAHSLDLSSTELGNLELHVAIIRAQSVATPLSGFNFNIVYGVENFENAIRLFESDEAGNAAKLAESHFWLARHDIGTKKYDEAENRLIKVVNYLENGPIETQLLRNETLQLLSQMKIKKGDIDTAKTYYNKIVTPEEHQGYLVPVDKPEAYTAIADAFLNLVPAYVEVEYDVDMFGKPFNIDIPYLLTVERNWTAPVGFEEYERYITELVANITYLPPLKNGEKIFVRGVKEKLVFRPHLAY